MVPMKVSKVMVKIFFHIYFNAEDECTTFNHPLFNLIRLFSLSYYTLFKVSSDVIFLVKL